VLNEVLVGEFVGMETIKSLMSMRFERKTNRHIRVPGRRRSNNVLRLRRKSLMRRRRILLRKRRRRVVLRVRLSVWARARWRIHMIIWLRW
jgi:hypothetical protein